MSKTQAVKITRDAEKRVSVDLPIAHFEHICAAAINGERTIPSQIRLIVREWSVSQSAHQKRETVAA